MLDINWIKANPEAFDRALAGRKNVPFRSAELVALDDQRRSVIVSVEEAQARRNALSKQIGQAKAQKDEAKARRMTGENQVGHRYSGGKTFLGAAEYHGGTRGLRNAKPVAQLP